MLHKPVIKLFILIFFIGFVGIIFYANKNQKSVAQVVESIVSPILPSNPLQISYMRSQSYPGSNLKIEQTLTSGSNYKRYIVSYISSGLRIYGLLTIPNGEIPKEGYPAIIFNHGYITPEKYTPDGNYIACVNAFASNGFVVFKPDYRGNGKSEGTAGSAYFSSNYDIDKFNAIASIKKFNSVNPNSIGVWGHSMGGHITLVDLVTLPDIKAAVIWGGVVGSYDDILYNWQNRVSYKPDSEDLKLRNLGSYELISQYGTPSVNPSFWNSIDPTANLNLINTPIQIHVGLADNQVPPEFSQNLFTKLKTLGKTVEFYSYPSANHDISSPSFNIAIERSINFFKKYLQP